MLLAIPPKVITKLYPSLHWEIETTLHSIYITFDDGPTEGVTNLVLDKLKSSNAKATFFALGKNILLNQHLYSRIIDEGHGIANHTMNHLNGWKSRTVDYLKDVKAFNEVHNSKLFRPPYGKLKPSQIRALRKEYKIIMWSILSMDYDHRVSKEKSWKMIKKTIKPGSIIVFHDSVKAKSKMLFLLDHLLELAKSNNWECRRID